MRTLTLTTIAILAALAVAGCGGESESGGTDLPFVMDARERMDALSDAIPSDPGTIPDDAGTDVADAPTHGDIPADSEPSDTTPVDPGTMDTGAEDSGQSDPGTVDEGSFDPGPPACDAGLEACLGSMSFLDGKTCESALIVGRVALSATAGYRVNPDVSKAGNNDDLPSSGYCRDPGPDKFWRLFMKEGEMLSIQLLHPSNSYQRLKVYEGISCSKAPSTLVVCEDSYTTHKDGRVISYAHTATADGWVSIVVDTRDDDWEELKVLLDMHLFNCPDVNCCCPY